MQRISFSPVALPVFAAIAAAPYTLLVLYVRHATRLRRLLAYYDPLASSLACLPAGQATRDALAIWDAGAGRVLWLPLSRVERVVAKGRPVYVRPARLQPLERDPQARAAGMTPGRYRHTIHVGR
ncbi:MAG: hypothetical protein R2834_02925 [Rhodothermales bacterium]